MQAPEKTTRAQLRKAYLLMRRRYGHLGWWPGDTSFEICVGAILTQNTSWGNVERAIANLKQAGVLEPRRMFALPETELARLIRPAGYFNVKARRLRHFLRRLVEDFDADLGRLFTGPLAEVRDRLLAIHGIGPETADSMLLYAGGHLSFVVDAYTNRIFRRHGWCDETSTYDDLQTRCVGALNHLPRNRRLDYWQDYHAQLVMIGKDYCRPRDPKCRECPLGVLLGDRQPVS